MVEKYIEKNIGGKLSYCWTSEAAFWLIHKELHYINITYETRPEIFETNPSEPAISVYRISNDNFILPFLGETHTGYPSFPFSPPRNISLAEIHYLTTDNKNVGGEEKETMFVVGV